jgi:hypothetical protein
MGVCDLVRLVSNDSVDLQQPWQTSHVPSRLLLRGPLMTCHRPPSTLTTNQAGLPAELGDINKRRTRIPLVTASEPGKGI